MKVILDTNVLPLIIILHGIHESGKFIKYRIGNNHFFSKNEKGFLLLPHFQPSQCVNANQLIFDFFQKHDNKGIVSQ